MAEKKKSYKRYKDFKQLIAIAESCFEVKGKGVKRVAKAKADEILDNMEKDGKYSDAEKAAYQYIKENYIFTDAGYELLWTGLRDWALERGRATQAAEQKEEEAKKVAAEEAKKEAAEKKKAAKAKTKKAKKEGPRTTKIAGEDLDYNLVKFALKCVEANITAARKELGEEDYEKGDVGGRKQINKDDVSGLIEIVFEDGVYSELERDTMDWIRSNIGMTKGAREEWGKQYTKAKAAAKKK